MEKNMISAVENQTDIEAIESSGECIPAGVHNTYDLLKLGASIGSNAPALSFFLRTEDQKLPWVWSHHAWMAKVTQAANMLRRLGVQRDSVVAYVLPNLPETHWTIWGAETAGVVMALNPLLEPTTLLDLMLAANVQLIVTLAPTPGTDLWEKVSAIADRLPNLQGILATSPIRYLSSPTDASSSQSGLLKLPSSVGATKVFDLLHEMSTEPLDELTFVPPQLDDVASYFCTGGTTGLPKIAVRTHRTEVANAVEVAAMSGSALTGPGNTVFCGLPLFHVNAQIGTGLSIFSRGGHVLLGTPQGYRTPGLLQAFWSICSQHKVTTFSGVPTIYAALLQSPREGFNLESIRYAVCGAAPMPIELFKRFQAETGIKIVEGYGLTEAGCVSSLNPPAGEGRVGSIGLRLPWQQMRVVRLDSAGHYERDAHLGEPGLIVVTGPNLFQGYLNSEHNKGLWLDIAQGMSGSVKWLNTGDLGHQDAQGYFWLTGRAKELIIRGGHNLDPKSIEEVLARHPAVALCAAVGRPDEHAGEVPVAYVQLRPGVSCHEKELLDFAAQHIGERAAVPKSVTILSAIPLTDVGKISKVPLRLREIESVVGDEANRHSIKILALVARQDAQRGLVAEVTVLTGEVALMRIALGRYTFASSVTDA
jgi:acyl-CoA synthetase (AMP-forming)/AMP-acid ligase II